MSRVGLFSVVIIFVLGLTSLMCVSEKPKPGVYRTWEEVVNNDPSEDFSYKLVSRKKMFWPGEVTGYKLKLKSKEVKYMGDIYGFCDGETQYVSVNEAKSNFYFYFYPIIEKRNGFGYYEYAYYKRSGCSTCEGDWELRKGVVDLSDGKFYGYSKKSLKAKLEANDKTMYYSYISYKGKDKLQKYLMTYAEKYGQDIKFIYH